MHFSENENLWSPLPQPFEMYTQKKTRIKTTIISIQQTHMDTKFILHCDSEKKNETKERKQDKNMTMRTHLRTQRTIL